jgi:molecular chaperone DnaK
MYKSQHAAEAAAATADAGAAAGQQGPGANKPDEKVVDAEFEEVDEKKKSA